MVKGRDVGVREVEMQVLAMTHGAGLHLVVEEAERGLHALGDGRDGRVLARVEQRAGEGLVHRHVHLQHRDIVLAGHGVRALVGAGERQGHGHEVRLVRRAHEAAPEVQQVRGACVAAAAAVLAKDGGQQLEVLGHALVLLPRAARRVLVLGALDLEQLAVRTGRHAVLAAIALAAHARALAMAVLVRGADSSASHYKARRCQSMRWREERQQRSPLAQPCPVICTERHKHSTGVRPKSYC